MDGVRLGYTPPESVLPATAIARALCYTDGDMRRVSLPLLSALAAVALLGCQTAPRSAPQRPVDVYVTAGMDLDAVSVEDGYVVEFAPGHYKGHLRVDADDVVIVGAGTDETTIDGFLSIKGDSNSVSEMTIMGTIQISGDDNRVAPVDSRDATKIVSGTDNRY